MWEGTGDNAASITLAIQTLPVEKLHTRTAQSYDFVTMGSTECSQKIIPLQKKVILNSGARLLKFC